MSSSDRQPRRSDPSRTKPNDRWVWLENGAAPNTALPDFAELYDRRRPQLDWGDEDDPSAAKISLPRQSPGLDLPPASPVAPDLLADLEQPSLLGRGHLVLQARLREPRSVIVLALLMASPYIVTALFASVLGNIGPLSRTDAVPIASLLVVALQILGTVLCYLADLAVLGRIWLVNVAAFLTLMPLLALESVFAGVPYVSTSLSSAEPVVLTGLVTVLILIGLAVMTASLTWETPQDAALVFLPVILLVPVILSGPSADIPNRGLTAIVSVSVASALGMAGGMILPDGTRPLLGPIALIAELGALVAAGRGPDIPDTAGAVVPIALSAILVVTIVLTVAVPLMALWMRRVAMNAQLVVADDLEPIPR